MAREDVPGEKRLVAIVTAEDGGECGGAAAASCGGLPEYMVPAAFVRAGDVAADAQRQAGSQGVAGARG